MNIYSKYTRETLWKKQTAFREYSGSDISSIKEQATKFWKV
jgi:hypothetical protein